MVINESRIRFHAAFEQVLDELIAVVAKEKERDPDNYKKSPRAKPAEHYRLFFKWDKESNVIIYAWLNSEISLHKYRSHMEAYRAFRQKA